MSFGTGANLEGTTLEFLDQLTGIQNGTVKRTRAVLASSTEQMLRELRGIYGKLNDSKGERGRYQAQQIQARINNITDLMPKAAQKKYREQMANDLAAAELLGKKSGVKLSNILRGTNEALSTNAKPNVPGIQNAGKRLDDFWAKENTAFKDRVRALTQGALAEGKSWRQLSLQVRELLNIERQQGTESNRSRSVNQRLGVNYRAELIARTELATAMIQGQIAQYREMGYQWGRWSAAAERTCGFCMSRDGLVYQLDDVESAIPAHPRCRCSIIPADPPEDWLKKQKEKQAEEAADRLDDLYWAKSREAKLKQWRNENRGIRDPKTDSILNNMLRQYAKTPTNQQNYLKPGQPAPEPVWAPSGEVIPNVNIAIAAAKASAEAQAKVDKKAEQEEAKAKKAAAKKAEQEQKRIEAEQKAKEQAKADEPLKGIEEMSKPEMVKELGDPAMSVLSKSDLKDVLANRRRAQGQPIDGGRDINKMSKEQMRAELDAKWQEFVPPGAPTAGIKARLIELRGKGLKARKAELDELNAEIDEVLKDLDVSDLAKEFKAKGAGALAKEFNKIAANKLGEGAFGAARFTADGDVIKLGKIGDYEAAALKELGQLGITPKLKGKEVTKGGEQVAGFKGREADGAAAVVGTKEGLLKMERVQGQTLEQALGGWSPSDAKYAATEFLRVSAKMHRQGWAHNDRHSGNIVFNGQGKNTKAQFIDLGLAQHDPRAALIEALGNGDRKWDMQMGGRQWDNEDFTSPAWRRFKKNKQQVEAQPDVGRPTGIRRSQETLDKWMSKERAEELLEQLYDGVE